MQGLIFLLDQAGVSISEQQQIIQQQQQEITELRAQLAERSPDQDG